MGNTILKVNDLHVHYGSIHAIQGISFEVNDGEIVTLIGANGAGKSTSLNTVAGLLKASSGTIDFDGKSLLGVPAHKIVGRGMALCPEGRRVFLQLTVQETIRGSSDSESTTVPVICFWASAMLAVINIQARIERNFLPILLLLNVNKNKKLIKLIMYVFLKLYKTVAKLHKIF